VNVYNVHYLPGTKFFGDKRIKQQYQLYLSYSTITVVNSTYSDFSSQASLFPMNPEIILSLLFNSLLTLIYMELSSPYSSIPS
jgi:hypothetical protein